MDAVQEQHERAVGERFIGWYNSNCGTHYEYCGRAGEAPDLMFRDGSNDLRIEVTDAYYDAADAEVRWKNARGMPDAPNKWSGVNVDDALAKHITARIERKSRSAYGGKCFLLVNVNPAITTAFELEALLPTISLPARHFFSAIYLVGGFGWSSSGEQGGYRCWKLA